MKVINLTYRENYEPFTHMLIEDEQIITEYIFETYDQYGQPIGHTAAGDASVFNEYSPLYSDVKTKLIERFGLPKDTEVIISGDDIDELVVEVDGETDAKYEKFVKEYEEENSIYEEIEAVTYFNGHNWQTFVLSGDNADGDVLNDDDDTAIDILKGWNDVELHDFKPAIERGNANGYTFEVSRYQNAFEVALVAPEINDDED